MVRSLNPRLIRSTKRQTFKSLKNFLGPDLERLRKKIIKLFQSHGLKIILSTNLVQTDSLDVTLDLKSRKYWQYRKPNDQPLYILHQSNHPPAIKKLLPSMLSNRLSQLSCSQEEFEKAASDYQRSDVEKWICW